MSNFAASRSTLESWLDFEASTGRVEVSSAPSSCASLASVRLALQPALCTLPWLEGAQLRVTISADALTAVCERDAGSSAAGAWRTLHFAVRS
jgi:hypothetical protein